MSSRLSAFLRSCFSFLPSAGKYCLFFFILALAACQPAIDTSTLPAPTIWRVQVTPALRWLGPIFNECTRQVPGTALLYDEQPAAALDLAGADFTFSLEPVPEEGYSAVLGQVGLVAIVHPASPLQQLDRAGIEAIFSGVTVSWADLSPEICPDCAAQPKDPLKPYIYGAGDDLGQVLSSIFPVLQQRLPAASLAPDPEALRQAVAADPQALGFVPFAMADSSVRVLKISDIPPDRLQFPLLLSMPAEPTGMKRSWVLCVQDHLPH